MILQPGVTKKLFDIAQQAGVEISPEWSLVKPAIK
jgi:hypothetical protein